MVRYGRLTNIVNQDNWIICNFELDTERTYIHLGWVLHYLHLSPSDISFSYWTIIDDNLPCELLGKAITALSQPTFYGQAKPERLTVKRLHLTNFISYGPNTEPVELKPLNVLIGPNGSGKSNFMEAFSLLQATPEQVARPVAAGGGVRNWLFRGQVPRRKSEPARLEAILDYSSGSLRYALAFDEIGGRFQLTDELLEEESKLPDFDEGIYYQWRDGNPVIGIDWQLRNLKQESLKPDVSILAQKRDTQMYREITDVADMFGQIKLYREWEFGPYSLQRSHARADLPSNALTANGSNLGLIVNSLRRDYDNYQALLESLKILYPGIREMGTSIEGGNVQIFLQESNGPIPASRLSDGTLRYLFLLVILYDPNPPPLICLEEPELGLHPDVLPTLARLLHDASERTQLIVTTHSPILIDALSETPESILVCEQTEEGSTIKRLDADELKPWLEKYRLGQLWMRGDLGGTRW
jgi:predicted ATPase